MITTLDVMGALSTENREAVVAVAIGAILTIALTDKMTPRTVADQIFTTMPDDEMWAYGADTLRAAVHELRDVRLADWLEQYIGERRWTL